MKALRNESCCHGGMGTEPSHRGVINLKKEKGVICIGERSDEFLGDE